jgi:hypothetical protein
MRVGATLVGFGLMLVGIGLLLVALCAAPLLYFLLFVNPAGNSVLQGVFCVLGGWLGLVLVGAGVWMALPGVAEVSPRSRRNLG